jgi:hypothetical protein
MIHYAAEVSKVRKEIEAGKWRGDTAGVASEHLRAAKETFKNAQQWVGNIDRLLGEHNTQIREKAETLLAGLPDGGVPLAIVDAVRQGAKTVSTQYGVVPLPSITTGLGILHSLFSQGREREADKALVELTKFVEERKNELSDLLSKGFDVVKPKPSEPIPEGPIGGPGGPGGKGGPGGPGGPGLPPIPPPLPPRTKPPTWPDSSRDDDSDRRGGVDTRNNNKNDRDPRLPPKPPVDTEDERNRDRGWDTDDDHNRSLDNREVRGPSVDSHLTGSTMRNSLGAAGLGAAGLAAGVKLAGGSAGLAGGIGGGVGLAAGLGGGGLGGLQGAAAAKASGSAAGAGANTNASGARGAGKPGMMMGGQGGASDSKKGAKNPGLGYIAPKLEDEGDGGPAAQASRAGRRGDA